MLRVCFSIVFISIFKDLVVVGRPEPDYGEYRLSRGGDGNSQIILVTELFNIFLFFSVGCKEETRAAIDLCRSSCKKEELMFHRCSSRVCVWCVYSLSKSCNLQQIDSLWERQACIGPLHLFHGFSQLNLVPEYQGGAKKKLFLTLVPRSFIVLIRCKNNYHAFGSFIFIYLEVAHVKNQNFRKIQSWKSRICCFLAPITIRSYRCFIFLKVRSKPKIFIYITLKFSHVFPTSYRAFKI